MAVVSPEALRLARRLRQLRASAVGHDDLTGHIILIGGVVWNEVTGRLSNMARLPVRQVETFGDAAWFAVLMSVQVIRNYTITPDFSSNGVVLYQWWQDIAGGDLP
jgi:hypothetical protein